MKKRSIALISIILILATVMPLTFGACSKLKLTLTKPSLSYENGVVEWSEIGFASEYSVCLYEDVNEQKGEPTGIPITVQTNRYVVPADGIHWVGVKALSDKSYIKDSEEAFIRVVKENTEDNVNVPDDGKDPTDPDGDGDEDPVKPPDTGEDVLPSNAPDLNLPIGAVQRFNYMSIATLGGISVALTENTGKVERLFKENTEETKGWSYDAMNKAVNLDYTLFAGVSEGSDTKFTAVTENGASFDFYVTLCGIANLPAGVDIPSYGAYVFCKNSSDAAQGVTVTYGSTASTKAVSVDGQKISNSTTNFVLTSESVKFKETYLKTLSYGVHKVELFTTKGIIDFYLFIYSSSIMCYDLEYEFDDAYPSLVLRWKVDYPIDKYEVVVDGVVYSSEDSPEKFDGNSFALDGIVGEGEKCSAYVKSYVDGISTPATSATVAYADSTADIKDYLDPGKGFTYLGNTFNRYIDGKEEMDNLAYYMILFNDQLDTKTFNTTSGNKEMSYMDIFIDPSLGAGSASSVMSLFAESCAEYKESIKYSFAAVKLSDGAYRIGISLTSKNEALYDSSTGYSESSSNEYHLTISDRASGFEDFPINDREGVVVDTSDQLFFAIEAGYRPIPTAGSVAEKLYELAKDVCRTYIDDDMTDYEKVHAIYDWLGKNVVYDYNLVNEMAGIEPSDSRYDKFYSYDSFYLEGVLENGVAVCNGIAKTFVVLCGIEGIRSVKVNGYALDAFGRNSGAHAWNKVLINEKWYIVDSTWSNQKSTGNKEVFSHDYIFLTTTRSASDRTETTEDTLGFYCGDVQINTGY